MCTSAKKCIYKLVTDEHSNCHHIVSNKKQRVRNQHRTVHISRVPRVRGVKEVNIDVSNNIDSKMKVVRFFLSIFLSFDNCMNDGC